jgi:hypothetical protein
VGVLRKNSEILLVWSLLFNSTYSSNDLVAVTFIVLEYDTGTFPILTVAKNTAETFPNESGSIPVINKPEIKFKLSGWLSRR